MTRKTRKGTIATRPRGRPKSERGTPERREFRCHDDDWETIKQAAKQAQMPTGTYVRETVLTAAKHALTGAKQAASRKAKNGKHHA